MEKRIISSIVTLASFALLILITVCPMKVFIIVSLIVLDFLLAFCFSKSSQVCLDKVWMLPFAFCGLSFVIIFIIVNILAINFLADMKNAAVLGMVASSAIGALIPFIKWK